MFLVLRKLYDGYHQYMEYKDPRNCDFLLLRSPLYIFLILTLYLSFVRKIGPHFMSQRKPYQLRGILLAYNLFQVIFSFVIATSGLYYSYWQPDFDYFGLHHFATPNGEPRYALAVICYLYFWAKVCDLFDTVFFVLRKKSNQISFLHLYHHCIMIVVEFIHNKFFAGSHYMLLVIINSFVHTIMYSYYFLTIQKPDLQQQQSLWWKKHLTELQMVQFSILIIHFGWPIFSKSFHSVPIPWCIFAVFQTMFMFLLFADFYRKAYLTKGQQGSKSSTHVVVNGIAKKKKEEMEFNNNVTKLN
ncbi:very long chain fatty acid elongase 7-like [Culicoides brevitarsis]|uniref:very long chain fatty acid elongase 7-like n=1 Tax=Culicoides brevitarsis TaxID=469753 RepID=UPI00307BDDE4